LMVGTPDWVSISRTKIKREGMKHET